MAAVLTIEAPATEADAAPAVSAAAVANAQLLTAYRTRRTDRDFQRLHNAVMPLIRHWAAARCSDEGGVDEIVQATLILVAEHADRIDPLRLHAWLREVVRRVALEVHRRTGAAPEARHADASDLTLHVDIGSGLADEETRNIIAEELRQLPEPLHRAVTLCYLQGVNVREAAKILGVPSGSMSMLLDRAKRLLRPRLIHRGMSSAVVLVLLSLPSRAGATESARAATQAWPWIWWLAGAAAAAAAIAVIPWTQPPAVPAPPPAPPAATAPLPPAPVVQVPMAPQWHVQEFPRRSLEWYFSGSGILHLTIPATAPLGARLHVLWEEQPYRPIDNTRISWLSLIDAAPRFELSIAGFTGFTAMPDADRRVFQQTLNPPRIDDGYLEIVYRSSTGGVTASRAGKAVSLLVPGQPPITPAQWQAAKTVGSVITVVRNGPTQHCRFMPMISSR